MGDRAGESRIRIAQDGDLPAVREITAAAYAVYLPVLGGQPGPVLEDHAPRVSAGQVWLMEVGGEVAGLLVLERHPDHAMIFSVAVVPERQGRGHGATLLRFAERTARSWGVGELRLYTNVLMHRNLAIYRAAGFRETGRRPHPARPGFLIADMARPLD
ncbi:MAG: GNAT family N-acetyltransferase [Gluconacetobacter diazotrophicus]|nr:GNAT family N-acetyltransferase [Gluconacetobacter diazotrophicus]